MDVCTGILLRMLGAVNRRFPCVRLRGIFLRQFSGLGVQAAQGSTFRVYDFEKVSVGVKSRDMVFSGLKFRGFCFSFSTMFHLGWSSWMTGFCFGSLGFRVGSGC